MHHSLKANEEKQRLVNQNNGVLKARANMVNKEGQKVLNIKGIEILFPFKPYDCQLTYMEKVIDTLQGGSSALLESPTGTGKTLSLLCSVLGWRHHLQKKLILYLFTFNVDEKRNRKQTIFSHDNLKEFQMAGNSLHDRIGIPNVIYSTRTHTQLNQCVQELKACAYNPKMAILGSRGQLCVHPKVSKEKGSKQNTKCRQLNAPSNPKKCWFRQGSKHMDQITKNVLAKHTLDVEDLHLIGKDQGFCPYYHSIDACKDADIIFMPYNYLVDANIRPPTVNLAGAIIIFDEAHNIESVCCDSVSFELRSDELTKCIHEVQHVIDLNKSDEDCMISKEDLFGFKQLLLDFEKVIGDIELPPANGKFDEPAKMFEGKHIFKILEKAKITMENKDTLIDIAQDILRELITPEAEKSASATLASQNRNSDKYGLETFVKAMQTIFGKTFSSDSFKVNVADKNQKGGYSSFKMGPIRSLSLWCFNPGVAITGLKNDVHAMILTSGTLSPLQSFSSELQIEFPIRLENKHLVNDKQVYIGVLEKGPCSRVLSSEYTVRTTQEYMKELGNSLINITRRIPFGMLVFFASYKHMEDCVEFWHRTRLGNLSIMEHLEKNKHVICEPRGGGQSAVKQVFEEYSGSLRDTNNALLFAVMRGKVSEGMDFADNFARCVVIAGIPYPYMKDPKIQAKKQYMDRACWKATPNKRNVVKTGGVNGQEWYQQQAVRAVNQAIGRVIRHRFDYGAIILADRRFARKRNQEGISKWIRPYIKTVKNFGLLTRDLNLFFKDAQSNFDHLMKKKKEKKKDEESFDLTKVKQALRGVGKEDEKNELEAMLDANGLRSQQKEGCSSEGKFKRYARKRKHSNVLDNMQKFMTTPKSDCTPNSSFCKKRKMNIAYQLNDCTSKPTACENEKNDPNLMNLSFHGTTPTAAQKLKQRMMRKNEMLTQQLTQHQNYGNDDRRALTQQNPNDANKLKAQKLRLQNAQLTQTQSLNFDSVQNKIVRKKIQNDTLQQIKKCLSKQEYETFKSVLKTIQKLKSSKSTDEGHFDECVITPFIALFSTPKRKHLIKQLKRYIPKQFHQSYENAFKDMESPSSIYKDEASENEPIEHVQKKRKINLKQRENIYVSSQPMKRHISASSGDIARLKRNYHKKVRSMTPKIPEKEIVLSMPSTKNQSPSTHFTLDDTFVKMRKLQDGKADVSQPYNKHKRKRKQVVRNKGFEAICAAMMSDEHFEELKICIKEWKGIDANEDRHLKLKKITDVLFKSCKNDIENGHLTKFRSMAKAFDKILTTKTDKSTYHNLIQNEQIMQKHLDKIRQRKASRQVTNC